jgi:hypothetical protein
MASIEELQLDFLKRNCSSTIRHLLFLHLNETKREEFNKNYYALLFLRRVSRLGDSGGSNNFTSKKKLYFRYLQLIPLPMNIRYSQFWITA